MACRRCTNEDGGCAYCNPLPVEHTMQPVRGYRTWVVRESYDWLGSRKIHPGLLPIVMRSNGMSHLSALRAGVNDAQCLARGAEHGPVPAQECTCGFYAWHRPEYVQRGLWVTGALYPPEIVGVVEAAGRIIWGCRGWRAERMMVAAAYCKRPAVREMVAATYGVTVYEDYDSLIADFPPTMAAADVPPMEHPLAVMARKMRNMNRVFAVAATAFAESPLQFVRGEDNGEDDAP